MSNLKNLDVRDFKMTRLSDVIDLGAMEVSLENERSQSEESNLDKLADLVEQFLRISAVKSEDETLQENSILFPQNGAGDSSTAAKENHKQESTKKLLSSSEYTRDELLMLAASPASKLPPLGWDQVVQQLPSTIKNNQKTNYSFLIEKIRMARIEERKSYKTVINSTKPHLLDKPVNQEAQIKCDFKEPLSNEIHQAGDSSKLTTASMEQTENKNTFVDNLIQAKSMNNYDQKHKSMLDANLPGLYDSEDEQGEEQEVKKEVIVHPRKEMSPSSKASLLSSKASLPSSKASLPCSKASLLCSKASLPTGKASLPSSKASLLCNKASLLCSICKELCKRGVATPCCNAKACRYCAVKNLTDFVSNVARKCWSCGKSPLATLQLINDQDLRDEVQRFIVAQIDRK